MLTQEELEIYSRHILLEELGVEGQLKIKESKVLVIGAGGLGCPVLQYICAAGVGEIGIVDNDIVDKSNLQRQILFGYSSIGKLKTEEAKKRLNDINPLSTIKVYNCTLDVSNSIELFSQYDIIVDCTDNYQTRYLINDTCYLLNKVLVYGAIYKFEGQISVFNYENGPTYRCLYPEMPKSASITNCSESGVIGVLPGVVGTIQANEIIKLITGIGEPLSGKLLLFNGLTSQFNCFNLPSQKHEHYQVLDKRQNLIAEDYSISCENINIDEVEFDEFMKLMNGPLQILDVREYEEQPIITQFDSLKIPLNEISDRVSEIDKNIKTVVFCKGGVRSAEAINQLQNDYDFKNLLNLTDGIQSCYIKLEKEIK